MILGWMEAGVGVELGEKAEKQNICSNGKKEEASWIGGKAKIEENPPKPRREKQAELGEKLKKRIFAPTKRKEEKNR